MPSRNSVRDTAIQFVSLALGSDEDVALAALGLKALAAVVLVTVVVVTVGAHARGIRRPAQQNA